MSDQVPYRSVFEWTLHSDHPYAEPFVDVVVDAELTGPSGRVYTVPGFYDGGGVWRVRVNPGEVGTWQWRTHSRPANPDLDRSGAFEVTPRAAEGFLKATPGVGFGFSTEAGRPVFLLGDTVYNLFGMAHCGGDVEGFLRRRAGQGFNLLRVRLQVSPFHPPDGYSDWQTRRTWPWGGSEQSPRFDRFNLDYFRTVDRVVALAEALGVGLEMIMEAWGFEFPFNSRQIFGPEWEEVWLRYLVARYDAYNAVYFWTLMNEYEFYPDGNWQHNRVADRWAMRVGRWVKALAPHGHVIAVHNGPRMPPFAQRFAADPGAIDAIMFQSWGSVGPEDAWLAAGIEDEIVASFRDWPGSAVFAEYGYERNPDLPLTFPPFRYLGPAHNRHGAWRGVCCGLGVINGFENTWGPVMNLEQDQEGVVYLQYVRRFFTEVVSFHRLRPAPGLVRAGDYALGCRPLAMADAGHDQVVVYLPAGGMVRLDLPGERTYGARWYDPRLGTIEAAPAGRGNTAWTAPEGQGEGHLLDWVLVLDGQ